MTDALWLLAEIVALVMLMVVTIISVSLLADIWSGKFLVDMREWRRKNKR